MVRFSNHFDGLFLLLCCGFTRLDPGGEGGGEDEEAGAADGGADRLDERRGAGQRGGEQGKAGAPPLF